VRRRARHRTETRGGAAASAGALTRGPDALHLAAVFGISERAAMRYADADADAARAFLETPLEQ
jgi:hypothetical protein